MQNAAGHHDECRMEIQDIHPEQVHFHRELHRNDNAVIFLVSVAGCKCVMKVVSTSPVVLQWVLEQLL
jgi:hypothetical protein